ncbi:MAG: DNA-3-methyladenine glycosylase 2 family protein [Puia sp.]|nr:DNA-3-methyladenine glycosylase 2 family protein [Puia sp.]
MFSRFDHSNFHTLCDVLAARDKDLKAIIRKYGYPPLWSRPNTFETLVHIILEQQVSLASALSALNKLKEKTGEITPEGILPLTDEELKACYFSRQKTGYVRHLAQAIVSGQLSLAELESLDDGTIRQRLTAIKGIGNWTADIYLIFILHHPDVFPLGDLAAVNALKKIKKIPLTATREEIVAFTERWKPCRTLATMLLWHFYLEERKTAKTLS